MEVTILEAGLTADMIIEADYYDLSLKKSFTRKVENSPNERYNSYSSLIDNMYYQPEGITNAYELGNASSDIEKITVESNSFIFDRVPEGIRQVLYKTENGDAIRVTFGTTASGVIEYEFDQVVLLRFELEDKFTSENSPSQKLHYAYGHNFHRAYNAIQWQDSNSVISRLLIMAIFDTYDIDFSRGTLIGCDLSKYFVGNRVDHKTVPIVYGRKVDFVVDEASCPQIKDKTISQIINEININPSLGDSSTAPLFAPNNVEDLDFIVDNKISTISIERENGTVEYYKLFNNGQKGTNGRVWYIDLAPEEAENIDPVFSEDNFVESGSNYISAASLQDDIYYPPSQGTLLEYTSTEKDATGKYMSKYYYVYSPMINSGIAAGASSSGSAKVPSSDVQDKLFGNQGLVSGVGQSIEVIKPVIGGYVLEASPTNPIPTVHKITATDLGISLPDLESGEDWNFTKSGELIVNPAQIKRNYPTI